MRPPPRVAVTALGNPDRGDDAVGCAVAEALKGLLPEGVALIVHDDDVLALIDSWTPYEAVVCIDAAEPMGVPGRIHRLDLSVDTLPRDPVAASSHALGLVEAIALARALHQAPHGIIVYAVEGRCFEPGATLSPELAAAVPIAARSVSDEVTRLVQSAKRDSMPPTRIAHTQPEDGPESLPVATKS